MIALSAGHMSDEEKDYVPERERPIAYRVARIWLAIHVAVIAFVMWMQSILPLMVTGMPKSACTTCGALNLVQSSAKRRKRHFDTETAGTVWRKQVRGARTCF